MQIILPKLNNKNEIEYKTNIWIPLSLLLIFIIIQLITWNYQLKFNTSVLKYMDIDTKDHKNISLILDKSGLTASPICDKKQCSLRRI